MTEGKYAGSGQRVLLMQEEQGASENQQPEDAGNWPAFADESARHAEDPQDQAQDGSAQGAPRGGSPAQGGPAQESPPQAGPAQGDAGHAGGPAPHSGSAAPGQPGDTPPPG